MPGPQKGSTYRKRISCKDVRTMKDTGVVQDMRKFFKPEGSKKRKVEIPPDNQLNQGGSAKKKYKKSDEKKSDNEDTTADPPLLLIEQLEIMLENSEEHWVQTKKQPKNQFKTELGDTIQANCTTCKKTAFSGKKVTDVKYYAVRNINRHIERQSHKIKVAERIPVQNEAETQAILIEIIKSQAQIKASKKKKVINLLKQVHTLQASNAPLNHLAQQQIHLNIIIFIG